jgi:hypothetical protein
LAEYGNIPFVDWSHYERTKLNAYSHLGVKRTIEDTIQALADLAIGSVISAERRQRSRTQAQDVLRNVRNELDYLEKPLSQGLALLWQIYSRCCSLQIHFL